MKTAAASPRTNDDEIPGLARQSIQDFSASLTARAKLPPGQVADLLSWSEWELEQEIWFADELIKRIATALRRTQADHGGGNLGRLHPSFFSRYQAWKPLLGSLFDKGDEYEPFKRAALSAYLQYLIERRRAVHSVILQRHRQEDALSRACTRDTMPH
jgi:hypothetical protein